MSEIDKQNLTEPPKPEKPKKKTSGQMTLQDRGVRWKELKTLSPREWGCSFCKKGNANGQRRCGNCGSFLFQFGDLQFCYQTADRKQLTSDQKDTLKEEVLSARAAAE